jgi:hypothetical protein
MNRDLLDQHFTETGDPSEEARERIARRLHEAIRTPPSRVSDAPRRHLARGRVGRRLVAVPLFAILLLGAATLVLVNRHAPRPAITRISAVYRLAHPGSPVSLSKFDANTRRLLEEQGISGASNLGSAAGGSFYQFTEDNGRSCFGQAASEHEPVPVSQLDCFTATSGLPGPVIEMSTEALDPTKTATRLRLIRVAGIAASQVAAMEFALTDGRVVDVPVTGDVYGLPEDQIPPGTLASITATTRNGEVIWAQRFQSVVGGR